MQVTKTVVISEVQDMDQIAVLIPCYNESQTIEKVVKDWKQALPEAVVYVYDNNSTDSTPVIARDNGAVVRHGVDLPPKNKVIIPYKVESVKSYSEIIS